MGQNTIRKHVSLTKRHVEQIEREAKRLCRSFSSALQYVLDLWIDLRDDDDKPRATKQ